MSAHSHLLTFRDEAMVAHEAQMMALVRSADQMGMPRG